MGATALTRRKKAGLMTVTATFAIVGLLLTIVWVAGCSPGASSRIRPQRLAWMVVDGTHLDLDLAPMPFLARLIAQGAYDPLAWVGQAPNNTPASHATFGTGLFPSHHGILDFLWRTDPQQPSDPLKKLMANFTIYTGGEAVWAQMERYGVTSLAEIAKEQADATVWAITSEKAYAIGPWAGPHGDVLLLPSHWLEDDVLHVQAHAAIGFEPPDPAFVDGWSRDYQVQSEADNAQLDTWATDLAIAAVQGYQPDILLINLSQTDEIGHKTGGIDGDNPAPLIHAQVNVDRQIERLWQAYADLGPLDETLFVICTDHAMAQSVVLGPYEERLDALHSIGVEGVSEGPREQMWLSDRSKSHQAAELLIRQFPNYLLAVAYRDPATSRYTTLLTDDVPQPAKVQEALDYLFDTTAASPQAADLRVVTRQPNGTALGHGRHYNTSWSLQHSWLILAGPGARQGYASSYPARMVDLMPTVTALLYPGYAGAWDGVVLADALTQTTRQQRAAQAELGETLQRYQRALMALEAMGR